MKGWASVESEGTDANILKISSTNTMLKFLARDAKNAPAILKLKREADCVALNKKVKAAMLSKSTETILPLSAQQQDGGSILSFVKSVENMKCNPSPPTSNTDFIPEQVVLDFVLTDSFLDFEMFSQQQTEKIPRNPTVEAKMRQLLSDIERKFGLKRNTKKIKVQGKNQATTSKLETKS